MFIGKYDQSVNYDFARMPGRSDSKPRPKRSLLKNAAKVGAGAVVLGAGLKNKGAITSGLKTGARKARSFAGTAGGTAKLGSMAAGDAAKGGIKKIKSGVGAAKTKFGSAKTKFGTAVAKRRGQMT